MEQDGRLAREDGIELAYRLTPGRSPIAVFLPGFRSDMQGSKAGEVAALCAELGAGCLRLDYAGHGASGGRFEDGTIGEWTADALRLIDRLTAGPLVLIGSSMGGWIALLAALARPGRVAALVGIAPAPDFTETLMWDAMLPAERTALLRDGVIHAPSQYGDPTPITRALIEDGRRHLLMGGAIPIGCPVRLLHGQRDADVPWEISLRLAERLASPDVQVTLVKDGDHRLSRPADLALLRRLVAPLLRQDGG